MSLRALIFIGTALFVQKTFSQDFFSYNAGNFSGINQVITNPATAADNRLKLDIILTGFDAGFNNSWFEFKRSSLKYKNGSFPDTWSNTTPGVPDNVYKNFIPRTKTRDRAAIAEARLLLPSVMYQLDEKNAIAFTWSIRQITNFDGITPQLANLFENELDLSVTQNHPFRTKNLSAVQMTWAEYGITYARVLKDKHQHFLKAGITPKLLQGIESGYLVVRDLNYLFSTKDTNSYFNMDFSFAHSDNFKTPKSIDSYRFVGKPTVGLDLGIVYEWRPQYQKFKYKRDGTHSVWRKDLNKYKLRFAAAIVDIGKIKFKKQGTYYDLDVSVRKENSTKFLNAQSFSDFDSIVRTNFTIPDQSGSYSILLPTALNTQLDYSINQFLYLNLNAHLANFYKSNVFRVHNYSFVSFAPRFEHYWFEVSVPFTYNTLSARRSQYIMTGLNFRAGPVCIGTNNLLPLFKGDVSNGNLYVILKVAVPYKHIRDQDGDGVVDKKDLCPDERGDPALKGCPDADHDLIVDKDDACPHQAGTVTFRGCPDSDGDGITDGQDACPFEKGGIALRGCPDDDGDLIINKDDACPEVAGPKESKGCPDSDNDGIIDKEDECPTVRGLAKYKGCMDRDNDLLHDGIDPCPDQAGPLENLGCPWPDTDKDGILDKVDSCINLAGVAAYKGCPESVKLAVVEKRILQKAFSSLEFESGKDIIKPISFPSLNALAKLLINHKDDWQIKLSGHTDNDGTEESNLLLSEKRAKAVQAYLTKKGVPEKNILTEWFGQTKPVADNNSKDGKKKNRRVEMSVLMKSEY